MISRHPVTSRPLAWCRRQCTPAESCRLDTITGVDVIRAVAVTQLGMAAAGRGGCGLCSGKDDGCGILGCGGVLGGMCGGGGSCDECGNSQSPLTRMCFFCRGGGMQRLPDDESGVDGRRVGSIATVLRSRFVCPTVVRHIGRVTVPRTRSIDARTLGHYRSGHRQPAAESSDFLQSAGDG